MFNLLKFVFSPHQWVELFTFYGESKGGGDAPDFTALAAAAEKAAVLGKELGDAQLAENTRQYDQNMAVTTPVVNAQLGLMNMTKEQGDDYFNYMKQYARPVEQQLYYEAMGFTPEEIDQINASRTTETSSAKAAYEAQQAANPQTVQKSIEIPTLTQALDTEGVIKGSDLTGKIKLNTTQSNQDALFLKYGASRDPNGIFPIGSTAYSWNYEPDPNEYYRKDKNGTYSIVEPKYKTVEGKQTVTFDVPTGASSTEKTVYDTPETDALTAKLGMAAKARMDALDQAGRDRILAKNNELAGRVGETDTQVYNRYANDIEAEAGQAVADSRAGYTNSVNSAIRQGIRYGFSPNKLLANANAQAVQQAGAQAGAANQTRKTATQTMYGRGVGQVGEELKGMTADRNFKIQDSAIATAKKQDVAGLYRNLPAASQGSYSLATNAGNSAVNNQNQTSNQYMQGVNQGNSLIMQGQQTAVQGLGSMVNAQTSYANSGSDSGLWGALGTVGGAALSKYSDENMKKDIEQIDDDEALEGINKTKISKWKYDKNKVTDAEYKMVDDKEHIGAMAQDLHKNLGKQVSDGKMVDLISAVGVTMAATKALSKKVDKLAKDKK
jgi:hypothetical protein